MIDDLKARHRGLEPRFPQTSSCSKKQKFAASYSRYSCDNSSPNSIPDQLVNQLRKARAEDRFIPWCYIFADYSLSGLDPKRAGFSSIRAVLSNPRHIIDTIYIDDFTRASRDEIEWWNLAALVKHHGKRLIGASDGFDLANEQSDLWLTMYSLLSRLFIKSLKQKVSRGMRGAVRRGTSVGKPALGYTLRPATGQGGNPLYGPDGKPIMEVCIDPNTQSWVVKAFELYGEKQWTLFQIAKHFNQLKVDGSDGWTASSIRQLLRRLRYIGIFIHHRYYTERDPETGKLVRRERPRKEWEVKHEPHLRIISNELWKKVWKRLGSQHKPKNARPSRNEYSASTLFSGTLKCGYCGHEIVLIRSTRKYKMLGCRHGTAGTHGCSLSSKSDRIVEECLLDYLKDRLLTPEMARKLLDLVNEELAREASKPVIDVVPLEAKVKELRERVRRLVRKVEDEPDEELSRGYDQRIKELNRQIVELTSQIRLARQSQSLPPEHLTLEQVQAHLTELREVLGQEIPAAAACIREITGPITITQRPKANGTRGAIWVACFRPDLRKLVPGTASENLTDDAEPVELEIDHTPKAERLALRVKSLTDQGVSINRISLEEGLSREMAKAALEFVTMGKKHRAKPPGRRRAKGSAKIQPKYTQMAAEVAHRMDDLGQSAGKIAQDLGVDISTVKRAYFHQKRRDGKEARAA